MQSTLSMTKSGSSPGGSKYSTNPLLNKDTYFVGKYPESDKRTCMYFKAQMLASASLKSNTEGGL